ncbi:TPA: hypothetical protein ACN7OG_002986, partial [Klebsiella pneumoniae]
LIESRVRIESKSCRSRYIGSNGRFLEISRDLLPIEYIATVLFSLHKAILPDGVSPESFEKASP